MLALDLRLSMRNLLSVPLLVLFLTACPAPGGPEKEQPQSKAPQTLSAQAASSAPPPFCESGKGRCIDDDRVETCQDGARFVESKCESGALCLGGACLALRAPTPDAGEPKTLDPESLLAPMGEGFLNAWAVTGLLAGPLSEDKNEASPPLRPLCAPDGYVAVHPRERSRGFAITHYELSAYLLAGSAQRVVFLAGVSGRVRISIDDERLIDVSRSQSGEPFRDEIRTPFELAHGIHRLLVEIEQPTPLPTGFFLRIKTLEGKLVPDLLFTPDPSMRCGSAELLQTKISHKATAEGFSLAIRPSWPGLGPRKPEELKAHVELVGGKNSPPRVLADTTLPFASLSAQDAAISALAPLEQAAMYTARVTFGKEGAPPLVEPLLYRGALHKRIFALDAKREAIANAKLGSGDRESLVHHLDTLIRALERNEADLSWLSKHTKDAESLFAALEKGENPYDTRHGVVHRAYRSPLDQSLQPYALFVPRAYRADREPQKPLPLVVAAHGLNNQPEMALRVVVGEAPEKGGLSTLHEARHLPSLPDFGAFIVAPWGFGNAGQRHLGEDDILRVVAELRARYPIDARRISITGYSLGGTVAFGVPLHYPDLFAASAPLCGYPNLLAWESVRKVPHTPWEDLLLEKRYIVNWAENGEHLPLHIIHGGKDDPSRSELVANRYKRLGYSYKFDVQDELDHNVWDYGYKDGSMIAWLKAHKKPEAPERVRFVTGEYRYDRAYWVRLVGMEDSTHFAEIDARLSKSEKELSVKTRNVTSFGLDLDALSPPEETRLVIDGRDLPEPVSKGMVWLVKGEKGFERTPAEPSREGKKRAGVSGPLDDVDRHAQLIVYGTQDPSLLEANRMVAEHLSSFDTYEARFVVKSDTEISDAEINTHSLVLVGNPASNRVSAALLEKLPVRFEPGALVFRGERYEGEDVGVSFIYPHPRNKDEYVVMHAGVGAAGTLAARHLPRFAPDYLVYDGRITVERGGRLLGARAVRAGGFFDEDWR